jgi:uncharacterized protein (TIGR00730 family)
MGRGLTDEELLHLTGVEGAATAAEDLERLERIKREMGAGFEALAGIGPAVSVFGSARTPPGNPVYEQAVDVSTALGDAGWAIITGGGPGLMEAANRGAQRSGALSIGLDIELPQEQETNPYLDRTVRFAHFFARKVCFVRFASAFVIHPGGFGTMDELFEALNLISTATIRHFPVILIGVEHWAGLLAWMAAHMVGSGALEPREAGLLRVTDDPAEVVEIVAGTAEQRRSHYEA